MSTHRGSMDKELVSIFSKRQISSTPVIQFFTDTLELFCFNF